MNRKSITQEYFALATDENGNMPPMRKDESNAGLVVAGFMDLLLSDVISVDNKKITVATALPDEFGHIASLYEYLNMSPRYINKMMADYYMGPRINQLLKDVGESLLADGLATKGKNGLFGPKVTYIAKKDYRDELIAIIKSALAMDTEIAPSDVTLIYLLQGTKNLNRYLSRHESDELEAKLKEMKKNPQNKQLADMINYVSEMVNMIMAFILYVRM